MADERYKSVSAFALPDEYQRQATEARRRRRMAEILAQQAYQPSDISAPIPAAAPLVQGLQAFLAARAERKADEAESRAAEQATATGSQIAGRLMGGAPLRNVAPPDETGLGEVAIQSRYRQDPLDAMRLAMTPAGNAAMRGNPLLASLLAKTMEKSEDDEFYAPVVDAQGNYIQFSKRGGTPRASTVAAQSKEAALTELGKLINERNERIKLNPNDPSIKIYDAKIRNVASGSGLSAKDIADLNLGIINAGLKRLEIGQNLPPDQAGNLPVVPATVNDLLRYGGARQSGGNVRAGQTYLVGEQGPELVKFNQPGTVVPNPATTASSSRSVIERTSPKERMKLEQQQPTDKKSVVNALSQVSMMRNLVRDLRRHGGVDYIFGPMMSRLPNVRGAATSAQSLYDTLLERTSVEAMKQNRQEGFAPGSITQQEWPRFESTIAPLKQTKEPAAMRRALENADAQLQSMEQRIIDNYEQTYGQQFPLDYTPPSYKFESELYPNEQTKKEKQAIYNRADAILRQMQQRR